MCMLVVNRAVRAVCLAVCVASVKGASPDLLDMACADGTDSECFDVLSALQFNSSTRSQAQASAQVEGNICSEGFVGKARVVAPTCIDACPQACEPFSLAIIAYLTKGGPAAKKVMCQYEGVFECNVGPKNIDKCLPLIAAVQGSGFRFPESAEELHSICQAPELAQVEGNACSDGLVGKARAFAPTCIDACPQSCEPLNVALNAYLTKGGQPAAKKVICQYESAFECPVAPENIGKCLPLIAKVKSYGFRYPESVEELRSTCQ